VRTSILCLLVLGACLPLGAQETPVLNEVVVTATRIDSTVLDSPSAVTVITQQQIAASGAHDLAGVINSTPSAVINDYGPAGATQSVSLRGSSSSQVVVMLDGIRLNSSRDGGVDLSTIPLEGIDHIEIVRGGESALYGTSAIGGVINIITKKSKKAEVTFDITNGSYLPHAANEVTATFPSTVTAPVDANFNDLLDTQRLTFSINGKAGDTGLTTGGSFLRAANGFTWYDSSQLQAWRRRTNADTLAGNAYVGLTTPLLDGNLAMRGTLETSDTGAPGSLTFISVAGRQTDTNVTGSAGWKTDRFLSDALTLDLKGFYRYDTLTYNDPAFPPESIHRTQTASLDATQRFTASEQVSAIYGASGSFDYVDSTNFANPKNRLNLAGFVSVPYSPVESLTITPTVRYDYFSDFAGALGYSLSAVLRLWEESSVRASAGSSYRVPALNDLYWYDPSGFSLSNPNLKPETSYDGEIGWSLVKSSLSLDASLFTRLVLNNIIWFTDPVTFVSQPQNLTRTLFPGAELHAKWRITERISLEASYTLLYSFLLNDGTKDLSLSDDRRVPFAPLHSLSAQARYDGKYNGFGVEVRGVSQEYTDTANIGSNALPAYVVVNADYRFTASENMKLTLAVKNIFNMLYYTQAGYPMPPFSIETGVSVHI
jgi:outer membrane cobalamin receptor